MNLNSSVEIDRADYRVELDPANPGHFLAVCGIAKLHSALDPLAVSWFETVDGKSVFCGSTMSAQEEDRIPLSAITGKFAESGVYERGGGAVEIEAFGLTIDWWIRQNAPNLKTWAGRQNPAKTLKSLLALAQYLLEADDGLLTQVGVISNSPFNYDPNLLLEETQLNWSRDVQRHRRIYDAIAASGRNSTQLVSRRRPKVQCGRPVAFPANCRALDRIASFRRSADGSGVSGRFLQVCFVARAAAVAGSCDLADSADR